jgi:hypothetical protein
MIEMAEPLVKESVKHRGWTIDLEQDEQGWTFMVTQPDRRGGFSPCLSYPTRERALTLAQAAINDRIVGAPRAHQQTDLLDFLSPRGEG